MTTDGTVRYTKATDELSTYYEMLDCSMIEMPRRKIGGLLYTIICDEEALLKDNPIPTVFDINGKPMIYGNVFFCLTDEAKGECCSLTHAHAVNLAEYLFCGIGPNGPRFVMSGGDY